MTMRTRFADEVSGGETDKNLAQVICGYRKCKRTFNPKRRNQKFCSPHCKKDFWKDVRAEGLLKIEMAALEDLNIDTINQTAVLTGGGNT